MRPFLRFALIASLLAGGGAGVLAQQDSEQSKQTGGGFTLSGSFGVGGLGTSDSSLDASKLVEYRDLSDGALGTFDVHGRSNRFYLDWFGENLGRTDTYFNLQGGVYDEFKYQLYGNWLTHNFGFGPYGGRTPFIDPGSTNLTLFSNSPAALANTSVPPWTSFDFARQRRDLGATLEFSFKSPWYVLVEANELREQGTDKADAAALGTSPGNGFVDLPYPVNYTTRNISGEAGYQKPRGHFSVNWMQSNFENENSLLNFQNPFFGFGQDTATFSPDDHYMRIGATGMLRQLFWDSTLSGRITYDKISDHVDVLTAVLNTTGSSVLSPTDPSAPVFNGEVADTTAHVSLASIPTRRLDTRIYYNLYKRSNDSTDIVFQTLESGLTCDAPGTTSPVDLTIYCETERYTYTKNNAGIEAEYRLTPGNRLSADFDYLGTTRIRFDSNATRDSKFFLQWSNTSLDTLTARVKYQYLQRRSDFVDNSAGFNAGDPYFLERFSRSFDVANLDQHLVKGYLDWNPFKLLDFGFEAYYKRNNYQDLTLGRLNDRRKEFYGSITYGDPTKLHATLFGDVELINYDSYHRTVNASACPATAPNCFDPSSAPTTAAFNWGAKLHDTNWTVQFGADWPLTANLTLKATALFESTEGGVDFQSQTLAGGAPANLLFPITAYDNTRRWSVNPHAVYVLHRVELSAGYAYDKYNYRDDQFTGYQYTVGTGTSTSFLSGIYAFPDYTAHIVYGTMRYRF